MDPQPDQRRIDALIETLVEHHDELRATILARVGADAGPDDVAVVLEVLVPAVVRALRPAPVRHLRPVRPVDAELSQPGADILRMVAEGRTNVEIAAALYLSRQAVNYHVGRLMRSLGAANRTALVSRAYQEGLLLTG